MSDRSIIRDLAEQYAAVTRDPAMDERREVWRACNSLRSIRPPVFFRGGRVWPELMEQVELRCQDPAHRGLEYELRQDLLKASLGDDTVFEPWRTVRPVFEQAGWGVEIKRHRPTESKGAWKHEPPLGEAEEWTKLTKPAHRIDEEATRERVEATGELIGDILPVLLDRSPAYREFSGDLSTDLGHLRGIENFMLDMYEEPDDLHALLGFLRDGVLTTHEQAETAGDWSLLAHSNQGMCYCDELEDPAADASTRSRSQLWGFFAAQEFTLVSPAQHDEFLLQYQLPLMRPFGLIAYGCCEDLAGKIDMLRQIPNLRRIAVAPLADIRRCSEQIGCDYVMSWRPNPAQQVCCGFDESRVRRIIAEGLRVFAGQHIDITLKDVDTAEGDYARCRRWVEIVREEVAAASTCGV